jgi:hypothetical protein
VTAQDANYLPGFEYGQGRNRIANTRIFSPGMVPSLCITIGHQVNQSKRLKGAALTLNLAIGTHSSKWFWQNCDKVIRSRRALDDDYRYASTVEVSLAG